MAWKILIVNFLEKEEKSAIDLAESWQENVEQIHLETSDQYSYQYASNVAEATSALATGDVIFIVYFTEKCTEDLRRILKQFQLNMSSMTEFECVVNNDPSPELSAGLFEFGVEQFVAQKNWTENVRPYIQNALNQLQDGASVESAAAKLQYCLISGEKPGIEECKDMLVEASQFDYRAAYAIARAAEATGDFETATEAYRSASKLNSFFRPAATALGEILLQTGKREESLKIFEELDKTNPFDIDRKYLMAALYVDLGDMEKAQALSEEMKLLEPESKKSLELNAQIHFSRGELSFCFEILDQLPTVHPFFSTKIHDLGVKFAHRNEPAKALILFQRAFKIVPPEMRYKVSFNASLAYRRVEDFEMAEVCIKLSEEDFGSVYPKLKNLKKTISLENSKLQKAS